VQGLSVDSEQLIASLVGVLLHGRSPSAIVWAVTTRIINAVKSAPSGARIQVLDKVSWIVPTIADLNASGAVPIKVFVAFVVAPSHHSFPCFVKGMPDHAMLYVDWRRNLCSASA
jgi:hypothetical protein